jgi:hypothetical protein
MSTFVSPSGAAQGANPGNPPGVVSYTAAANGSVDALFADATGLQALGWALPDSVVGSGVTANRLGAAGYKGKFFLDTTLNQFIWSDGAIWRKFDGTAA